MKMLIVLAFALTLPIQSMGSGGDLHIAAYHGQVEAIKVLLKEGADVNAKRDKDGRTPLHWAAWKGQVEAIKLLLKAGAKVNAKEKTGKTPLHSAALKGQVEAIKVLLKAGAKVNARDKDGDTPLHWAAWKGQVEAIKALLRRVRNSTPRAIWDRRRCILRRITGKSRLSRCY